MKSQTTRRPDDQRSTRSVKPKPRKYVRQTAHVEARRDGKPLIFGWGGHLSRNEKIRLERRAIWSLVTLIVVAIIGILAYSWVNINIITPGLPITTVNGQSISQSDYRKLLALKTQLEVNKIKGPNGFTAQSDAIRQQGEALQKTLDSMNQKIDDLSNKIKALPAGPSPQRTTLEKQLAAQRPQHDAVEAQVNKLQTQFQDLNKNTIPQEMQLFTQSQIGTESVNWLQEDTLIRGWLATQGSAVKAAIEPSSSAVNRAVKDFVANIPKSSSYNDFMSKDHMSDADVHDMMTLKLRRDNMQTYLAAQITSPAYQVAARDITANTAKDAQDILTQLKGGSDFAKLAKAKSLDSNTKTKGGDLGWLAQGQYTLNGGANVSAVIDNWLFNRTRTMNELSPVLSENGTFHIVQITGINPARLIDAATLKALKDNALTAWLLSQKAMPGVKVGSIDQARLLDPANMPPDLPVSAPSQQVPGAPPGGVPGGLPGGGPPGGGIPGGPPGGGIPGGPPGGGIPGQP